MHQCSWSANNRNLFLFNFTMPDLISFTNFFFQLSSIGMSQSSLPIWILATKKIKLESTFANYTTYCSTYIRSEHCSNVTYNISSFNKSYEASTSGLGIVMILQWIHTRRYLALISFFLPNSYTNKNSPTLVKKMRS